MPEELAEVKIRALLANPIQQHDFPATSGEMARMLGLSKWHFHRTFKRLTGSTPFDYFAALSTATSSTTGDSAMSESSVLQVDALHMGIAQEETGFEWSFADMWPMVWPDMDAIHLSS
jgi:methylphosphotriester-DNA--protein-cysteine methyltransferase